MVHRALDRVSPVGAPPWDPGSAAALNNREKTRRGPLIEQSAIKIRLTRYPFASWIVVVDLRFGGCGGVPFCFNSGLIRNVREWSDGQYGLPVRLSCNLISTATFRSYDRAWARLSQQLHFAKEPLPISGINPPSSLSQNKLQWSLEKNCTLAPVVSGINARSPYFSGFQ